MRVVSFNVNSIRMRMHQLRAVIDKYSPEFIGLQETKVQDDDFPLEEIQALGYHANFTGQKTHYGVALLSRQAPLSIDKGFPGDGEEAQKRFIAGRFTSPLGGEITVINGYFPQGENIEHPVKFPNKRAFYASLNQYLERNCSPQQQLIVMGDMNISPTDLDIGIGEDNRKRWLKTGKCSFQPEERQWLARLQEWGLTDSFREIYPDEAQTFSWFDYRSKGFEREPKRGLRIDLIMATPCLQSRCSDAGADYAIRGMDKPSDHAPVWSEFV
ncbi:MAG: exodeoxyribonuclease III [Gammaproteobacteria bacterium]|nr:exodeoxyribonuclease III [Gammaproteobacteria bacterium]